MIKKILAGSIAVLLAGILAGCVSGGGSGSGGSSFYAALYPEIAGHTFVQVEEYSTERGRTKSTVTMNLKKDGTVTVDVKYENSPLPYASASGAGTYTMTDTKLQMNIQYQHDENFSGDSYLQNMGKAFNYEYTPQDKKLKLSFRPILDGAYVMHFVRAD